MTDSIGDIPVSELQHYGVKGMKWGVRKDQDSSARSGSSKDPVASAMSTKLKDVRGSNSSRAGVDPALTALALYGGIAVSMIAYQNIAVYRDSGRKDAKRTGDREFKKNPELTKKMSVSNLEKKVVKQINPGFGEKGTTMNCRRATMAYEMRRRGYDVKATRSVMASGQTYKGMEKAAKVTINKKENLWGEKAISNPAALAVASPQKKAEIIFSDLGKNPTGARGELGVGWLFGGGHSMAWEVVNNKPIIFDTQTGKTYKKASDFTQFSEIITAAAQTRLDNKPINPDFIKRWVTDV